MKKLCLVFGFLLLCCCANDGWSQAERLKTSDAVGLSVQRASSRFVANEVEIVARHCQKYMTSAGVIAAEACAADPTTIFHREINHNLRTNAGGDWQGSLMGNTVALVDRPASGPSLTTASGADTGGTTCTGNTCFVKVTYNSALGESVPSAEVSQAVTSGNRLVITGPSSPGGSATSWNAYVGTSTGTEKLQSSAIAFGTNWTESTSSGLSTTTAPPTINSTAPGPACPYIAVTSTAITPAAGDTTLSGEITTNGLGRAIAAFTNNSNGSHNQYKEVITFTDSSSTTSNVQGAGAFTAVSSGTMCFENTFASTTLNVGDTLTLTWTVNF